MLFGRHRLALLSGSIVLKWLEDTVDGKIKMSVNKDNSFISNILLSSSPTFHSGGFPFNKFHLSVSEGEFMPHTQKVMCASQKKCTSLPTVPTGTTRWRSQSFHFSLICTGFLSQIGTKLRDRAVGQAWGSCYSWAWAALSSNDSKTL